VQENKHDKCTRKLVALFGHTSDPCSQNKTCHSTTIEATSISLVEGCSYSAAMTILHNALAILQSAIATADWRLYSHPIFTAECQHKVYCACLYLSSKSEEDPPLLYKKWRRVRPPRQLVQHVCFLERARWCILYSKSIWPEYEPFWLVALTLDQWQVSVDNIHDWTHDWKLVHVIHE
jgi:hypothetical protein